MDSLPKPVKTWDFKPPAHLPSNSDGQGLQWTGSGVELSGPGAYLHLPLELPIGACLTNRSLRIGMRFINDRVPLTVSLETEEGEQYEKLAFASGAHRGRNAWSLQRSAQPKNATFGTAAPIEQGVNVDIHLALVVDGSQAPNALYTCYRNSALYGNSARLTGFAAFQASDGIVLRIENAGAGRVVFLYAQVFDCALREDQLRAFTAAGAEGSTSGSNSQPNTLTLTTPAPSTGQSGPNHAPQILNDGGGSQTQPHQALKIFISYCHADETTKHRVRLLAERLHQADGQDVRLDMTKPTNISWPQWINTQFIECDKWVVVCDAEYKRRVDEPEAAFPGGGVSLEYFRMLNHLYDGKGANNKIVPVYFSDSERLSVVPQGLQHYACYGVDIPTEKVTRAEWEGYTSFYTQGLYDQPKVDLGVRAMQPKVPLAVEPLSRWS